MSNFSLRSGSCHGDPLSAGMWDQALSTLQIDHGFPTVSKDCTGNLKGDLAVMTTDYTPQPGDRVTTRLIGTDKLVGLGTCAGILPTGDYLTAILLDSGLIALVDTQISVEPAPPDSTKVQPRLLLIERFVRRFSLNGDQLSYHGVTLKPGIVAISGLRSMMFGHEMKLAAELPYGGYFLVIEAGLPLLDIAEDIRARPDDNLLAGNDPGPRLLA